MTITECLHESTILTRRTKTNGAVCVAKQCTVCGASRGEVAKSQYNLDALPSFNEALNPNWRQEQYLAQKYQLDHERRTRTGEWWESYKKYLNSRHWERISKSVIQRDKYCQCCLLAPAEQSHHISYESFNKHGISFAVECVGVCIKCHDKLHPVEAPV